MHTLFLHFLSLFFSWQPWLSTILQLAVTAVWQTLCSKILNIHLLIHETAFQARGLSHKLCMGKLLALKDCCQLNCLLRREGGGRSHDIGSSLASNNCILRLAYMSKRATFAYLHIQTTFHDKPYLINAHRLLQFYRNLTICTNECHFESEPVVWVLPCFLYTWHPADKYENKFCSSPPQTHKHTAVGWYLLLFCVRPGTFGMPTGYLQHTLLYLYCISVNFLNCSADIISSLPAER